VSNPSSERTLSFRAVATLPDHVASAVRVSPERGAIPPGGHAQLEVSLVPRLPRYSRADARLVVHDAEAEDVRQLLRLSLLPTPLSEERHASLLGVEHRPPQPSPTSPPMMALPTPLSPAERVALPELPGPARAAAPPSLLPAPTLLAGEAVASGAAAGAAAGGGGAPAPPLASSLLLPGRSAAQGGGGAPQPPDEACVARGATAGEAALCSSSASVADLPPPALRRSLLPAPEARHARSGSADGGRADAARAASLLPPAASMPCLSAGGGGAPPPPATAPPPHGSRSDTAVALAAPACSGGAAAAEEGREEGRPLLGVRGVAAVGESGRRFEIHLGQQDHGARSVECGTRRRAVSSVSSHLQL